MKLSNDTIGDRIGDLTACRAEPRPTAPPRTPIKCYNLLKINTDTLKAVK